MKLYGTPRTEIYHCEFHQLIEQISTCLILYVSLSKSNPANQLIILWICCANPKKNRLFKSIFWIAELHSVWNLWVAYKPLPGGESYRGLRSTTSFGNSAWYRPEIQSYHFSWMREKRPSCESDIQEAVSSTVRRRQSFSSGYGNIIVRCAGSGGNCQKNLNLFGKFSEPGRQRRDQRLCLYSYWYASGPVWRISKKWLCLDKSCVRSQRYSYEVIYGRWYWNR